MRFLFLGAGAIGTYVGGSLAAAGTPVTFVEQPAMAEVLARQGLTIHRDAGDTVVRDLDLFTSAADALASHPHDVVVFALKSFDTESAARGLLETGLEVPPVLSLQNGVDNEVTLARVLGPDKVIHGTVATAVAKPGVGQVIEETHRGMGVAAEHPLAPRIVEALDAAGLSAKLFGKAGPMKWSKLLTNLQGNAVSAILDLPVAEVYADKRLCAVEIAAMRECLRVMRALDCPPVDLPGTPVRALAFAVERLPRAVAQPIFVRLLGGSRGHKMPSFHIDLHSGRGQSEVSFINGAVVRHGQAVGVATPVNRVLTETLEALTAKTLDLEDFRRRPEALLRLL